MEEENKSENKVNQMELQQIEDTWGIRIFPNMLLLNELFVNGYRKMSEEEARYFDVFFQNAPQIIADKIKDKAVQKAFEEATKNSYKCVLDSSKHLATIKGTKDVYIGAALDNQSNQVVGQARWLENNVNMYPSKAQHIALEAFNALSMVTGQYFMSQVNANLSELKNGIADIQQYLDDIKQSELETAIQELSEILNRLRFIQDSPERVSNTIARLDDIKKVSSNAISLNKKQIERIVNQSVNSDKENDINENIEKLRICMDRYRYAVHVISVAKLIKIYLDNVNDMDELQLYRTELANVTQEYKNTFTTTLEWAAKYIEESKVLNKATKTQIFLSLGSGIVAGVIGGKYSNYNIGSQTISFVNDLFDDNRKKKKEEFVLAQKEYQFKMNDMTMIDSSISALDSYIELVNKKVEIIYIEGEAYIKYID